MAGVYPTGYFGATHVVYEYFITVTPTVGDYAGQAITIPAKNVVPKLKNVEQTSLKDNHKIAYGKYEQSTSDNSDNIVCTFEGLERKFVLALQGMQESSTGSLVEFSIGHPGKDARSTEGFIEDPTVNGEIQIGAKGEFTITFEGDIQHKPAA